LEAFFFPTESGERLFGVWRQVTSGKRVWVFCPPFAEEEKSARRTLTDIALLFEKRGESSLIFSYQGTGDSTGDFAAASLEAWRQDIRAAINIAKERVPNASIGLLGVRLGASLAYLERENADALCLIEPLLSGRSFLLQQTARKKMRAELTGEVDALPADDLDGWALGEKLKADLKSLDLKNPQKFDGESVVVQIGPKAEVAPNVQAFSNALGATAQAAVMPAFWNLLDYQKPTALLEKLGGVNE
jgi:alpha-beta hydrolase superfamily lysophospholipase